LTAMSLTFLDNELNNGACYFAVNCETLTLTPNITLTLDLTLTTNLDS
jgi:hypothetical protein